MSVVRLDLSKCIGCGVCAAVCPMDVFYLDREAHKSVLAYPENCQSCGQCCLNCPGRSIGMANETFAWPITAFRGVSTGALNHTVITEPGALAELTHGSIIRR